MVDTPPAAAAIVRLQREHAGRRVLLVEDNPINRVIAEELLRPSRLTVEAAVDGAQALAALRAKAFDLVLMDVQMPGMDGLAATRALRAAGARLPIVAMTAGTHAEDLEDCRAAGMDDVLTKPVKPQALYEMLLRWLPGPGPRDPLLERLAGIDGLDAAVALANVGGQAQALARVLGRFADTYHAGMPELGAASDPTQRRARRKAAHTLRGVAATLGAIALQDALEAFERADDAGLDEAELGALAGAAQDELGALVRRVGAALRSG